MPKHLADYRSFPVEFIRGERVYLFDKKGKKYLDFQTGWCVGTVGWANPEMAEAICAQARQGLHIPPWFKIQRQEDFASRLAELAPGKLTRVFRACSGSEAVEFGLKCARMATGKPTIVTIDEVYHGHTFGAASLGNACHEKMQPCLDGFIKLPMPRSAAEGGQVVEAFAELLNTRRDIAAFMSEPVWTNAGCIIPPANFYPAIEKLCRAHSVLLVMDEVATCMGRCGKMFGSELWGIEPDMITLGKSFTGGYATMAATLTTEEVFKKSKGVPYHATFGWALQDLAAVEKNVEIITRDHLDQNAREVGAYLLEQLKPLEKLWKVREVRGIGMALAIEFKLPIALLIVGLCLRKGLIMEFTDNRTLFITPHLCMTKEEAKAGADIIRSACGG
jgi:acetylornithine/succinyldiaminopimelate/putrescine aminotransferase